MISSEQRPVKLHFVGFRIDKIIGSGQWSATPYVVLLIELNDSLNFLNDRSSAAIYSVSFANQALLWPNVPRTCGQGQDMAPPRHLLWPLPCPKAPNLTICPKIRPFHYTRNPPSRKMSHKNVGVRLDKVKLMILMPSEDFEIFRCLLCMSEKCKAEFLYSYIIKLIWSSQLEGSPNQGYFKLNFQFWSWLWFKLGGGDWWWPKSCPGLNCSDSGAFKWSQLS